MLHKNFSYINFIMTKIRYFYHHKYYITAEVVSAIFLYLVALKFFANLFALFSTLHFHLFRYISVKVCCTFKYVFLYKERTQII